MDALVHNNLQCWYKMIRVEWCMTWHDTIQRPWKVVHKFQFIQRLQTWYRGAAGAGFIVMHFIHSWLCRRQWTTSPFHTLYQPMSDVVPTNLMQKTIKLPDVVYCIGGQCWQNPVALLYVYIQIPLSKRKWCMGDWFILTHYTELHS